MSEKEKEILKRLTEAIPKMDESKKEYLLGFADGIFTTKEREKQEEEKKQPKGA